MKLGCSPIKEKGQRMEEGKTSSPSMSPVWRAVLGRVLKKFLSLSLTFARILNSKERPHLEGYHVDCQIFLQIHRSQNIGRESESIVIFWPETKGADKLLCVPF